MARKLSTFRKRLVQLKKEILRFLPAFSWQSCLCSCPGGSTSSNAAKQENSQVQHTPRCLPGDASVKYLRILQRKPLRAERKSWVKDSVWEAWHWIPNGMKPYKLSVNKWLWFLSRSISHLHKAQFNNMAQALLKNENISFPTISQNWNRICFGKNSAVVYQEKHFR